MEHGKLDQPDAAEESLSHAFHGISTPDNASAYVISMFTWVVSFDLLRTIPCRYHHCGQQGPRLAWSICGLFPYLLFNLGSIIPMLKNKSSWTAGLPMCDPTKIFKYDAPPLGPRPRPHTQLTHTPTLLSTMTVEIEPFELDIEDILRLHQGWITKLFVEDGRTEVDIVQLLYERRFVATLVPF